MCSVLVLRVDVEYMTEQYNIMVTILDEFVFIKELDVSMMSR